MRSGILEKTYRVILRGSEAAVDAVALYEYHESLVSTFYFMLILFFNNVLNFCGDGSHNKGTGFFALQLRCYPQTPSQTL